MPLTNLNNTQDLAQITAEDIDSIGKVYGKNFKEIKTNQVRNVFSSVIALRTRLKNEKTVSTEILSELVLIRPQIAYAAGRQPKTLKPFYDFMDKAINCVTSSREQMKAIKNFISLIEAIVAYHKFFGGEDK